MKKSILTTIALALFAFGANAQVTSVTAVTGTPKVYNQTVNMSALPVIIDGGGGGGGGGTALNPIDFSFDTDNEYTNGISNVEAHQFKISATAAWNVSIETASQYFTSLLPANNTAVASNKLAWSTNAGSTYTPLTTSAASIKTGTTGDATTSGHDFKVYYKLSPGYVSQDTYSLIVKYTVSQL